MACSTDDMRGYVLDLLYAIRHAIQRSRANRFVWGFMRIVLLIALPSAVLAGEDVVLYLHVSAMGDESPEQMYSLLTQYPKSHTPTAPPVVQDSIFVRFPSPNGDKGVRIEAWREDGKSCDLELEKLSVDFDTWQYVYTPIASETNAQRLTLDIAEPSEATLGGYRVIAKEAGVEEAQTFMWVFVDDVELQDIYVENKCNELRLSPYFNMPTDAFRYEKFTYYNIHNPNLEIIGTLGSDYLDIKWTDMDGGDVPLYGVNARFAVPPVETSRIDPYQEMQFRVHVTNVFGRKMEMASAKIPPVAVKAKPHILICQDVYQDPKQYADAGSKPEGECPFYCQLKADTKNATSLLWVVRNDRRAARAGRGDTLFAESVSVDNLREVQPPYDLFSAGMYQFILTAENAETGCLVEETVEVKLDSSLISVEAIPNVFTPNGDGINDLFRFRDPTRDVRSVKSFDITVLDRSGKQVYYYEGDPRLWEGWNGQRNGDGGDCSPGVYFYIIRAEGYDEKKFWDGDYKGPLHLFR